MVVYWDLAAFWNFALDYLLLLGTLRLAGRGVRRGRLALAALFGAACSVAALATQLSPLPAFLAMLPMCRIAFGRTGRFWKLTLLFALLSCALGGAALLLGRAAGGMGRIAPGVFYARLPWGVFFGAAGLSYLLLTLVFRGGARYSAGAFVRARIECGGRRVELRLLRDTGNALCDPLTGEGVPVIARDAAEALCPEGLPESIRCRTVAGTDTVLRAFRCERLTVDGRAYGARLIAVSPDGFDGGFQGLWFDEARAPERGSPEGNWEETERHELETVME